MSKDYDAGPRVRTNNFFDIGVVGRRTGITMKANVKKDADGLDNIDDFWDDSDDNGAADNNQDGTQDYEQDDYSGEEYEEQEEQEVHPSPPARRSDPRLYLQQEAPEELLLTPTSRRSRGASKGALTGDSSLHGSHLYAGAEESPSIDKVRKRLVFTKDMSEDEEEEVPAPRTQVNKNASGSPALDKILSESKQRKVNMAMNSGREPSLQSKSTPFGSASSSSALKDKEPARASAPTKAVPVKAVPSKAAPAKPKQPSTQPSRTVAPARRPVGVPKAFNLGGDFDDQDDFTLPVYNSRPNLSDLDEEHVPPRATLSKSKPERPQPELKQKSRTVSTRLVHRDDDDEPIHDEPEPRPGDDDWLRFSDEDGPSRFDNDESEEDEVLQDNRRVPAQKKRTASTVEPTSVSKGGKRAAGTTPAAAKQKNIPKKADSGKNAQQKLRQRDEEEEDEEVGEVSSEDHQEVPSMQRSKGSSTSKAKGKTKLGTASGGSHKPQEKTTTHEIPIVPEEKPEEETGVRRSSRTKVAPLEYWKNEKLVFEKAVDEGVAGQVIKAVLRAQTEEGENARAKKPRGGRKRKFTQRSEIDAPPSRRQRTGRGVGEKEGTQEPDAEDFVDDSMDEEQMELAKKGVREEFKQSAETLVYGSNEVVTRVVAESQSSIQFRNVQSGEYQFHRGLEDADSVVSGTMKIKPDGRKPVNSGSNTSMVFYVIKGLVQVNVHETQFVLSTGGRFLVPRGNTYSIVNLSTKDSTLFFVQTKPPRPDTTDTSSSSATASTTAGISSNTKATTKPEKKSSAAAFSKSPSPPPATAAATNRRRSPSVRQSLSKTSTAAFVRSPSPPPSEATSKSNGSTAAAAAGVSRQPSVRPSLFR
ncbi:hypothetical protein BGW39_006280 [Mortierella sp. 14UC]|nr:hypothetical protein BGW39_006280 [Mortierella sp. 14UC]